MTFGRSESVFYAFTYFNYLSTVSLLDTSGNSIWSFSTSGGFPTDGNVIKYKEIDAATDMVIATSGTGIKINYNRIISSTSSNSVIFADSKTYRHTTLSIDKRLRGLFIVDKDNLVSLIWDNTSKLTEIASINLATPSVTYKQLFPKIDNMKIAVFVTASVYYTSSYHMYFCKT